MNWENGWVLLRAVLDLAAENPYADGTLLWPGSQIVIQECSHSCARHASGAGRAGPLRVLDTLPLAKSYGGPAKWTTNRQWIVPNTHAQQPQQHMTYEPDAAMVLEPVPQQQHQQQQQPSVSIVPRTGTETTPTRSSFYFRAGAYCLGTLQHEKDPGFAKHELCWIPYESRNTTGVACDFQIRIVSPVFDKQRSENTGWSQGMPLFQVILTLNHGKWLVNENWTWTAQALPAMAPGASFLSYTTQEVLGWQRDWPHLELQLLKCNPNWIRWMLARYDLMKGPCCAGTYDGHYWTADTCREFLKRDTSNAACQGLHRLPAHEQRIIKANRAVDVVAAAGAASDPIMVTTTTTTTSAPSDTFAGQQQQQQSPLVPRGFQSPQEQHETVQSGWIIVIVLGVLLGVLFVFLLARSIVQYRQRRRSQKALLLVSNEPRAPSMRSLVLLDQENHPQAPSMIGLPADDATTAAMTASSSSRSILRISTQHQTQQPTRRSSRKTRRSSRGEPVQQDPLHASQQSIFAASTNELLPPPHVATAVELAAATTPPTLSNRRSSRHIL